MQITQLNVITEIPFDFSQKYQTVPRPNRRGTVYFGTQLISVVCILLKKISMWALPTVPLFAGKSPFFTRNVPLKTFSRLAGLILMIKIIFRCYSFNYQHNTFLQHKRTGSNRCRRNVGNTVAHVSTSRLYKYVPVPLKQDWGQTWVN